MQRAEKITLGEMRSNGGPRLLIVYCSDFKCSHSVIITSELWPDHVRLSDLEPKFTCKACGRRGAVSGRCSRRGLWGLAQVEHVGGN
jgi:hypothetical protein